MAWSGRKRTGGFRVFEAAKLTLLTARSIGGVKLGRPLQCFERLDGEIRIWRISAVPGPAIAGPEN